MVLPRTGVGRPSPAPAPEPSSRWRFWPGPSCPLLRGQRQPRRHGAARPGVCRAHAAGRRGVRRVQPRGQPQRCGPGSRRTSSAPPPFFILSAGNAGRPGLSGGVAAQPGLERRAAARLPAQGALRRQPRPQIRRLELDSIASSTTWSGHISIASLTRDVQNGQLTAAQARAASGQAIASLRRTCTLPARLPDAGAATSTRNGSGNAARARADGPLRPAAVAATLPAHSWRTLVQPSSTAGAGRACNRPAATAARP